LFASGLGYPRGLAFDGTGNLFVSDAQNNRISRITPAGAVSTFASGLSLPGGLAFDRSGDLYVANYLGNTINQYTGWRDQRFCGGPTGIASTAPGSICLQYRDGTLRRITPAGLMTTFASGFDYPGHRHRCPNRPSTSSFWVGHAL
jgi:sugar lactone lactonase YvrE